MKAPPASVPAPADRIGLGIGSVVAAVSLFSIVDATAKWLGQTYEPVQISIVDATAKWLGQTYEPVQIVFFQALFGLIPIAVFVWRSGGLASLRTQRPFAHALRGILLSAAVLLFFTALRGLPLAEAIAITFTAPLFVTALSGPLLGEAVGVRRWAAVIIGFLGVLIMVRPGTDAFRPEALLVMTSALMYGLAMLLTRRLTGTETDVALVTYTTLITGLARAMVKYPEVSPPTRREPTKPGPGAPSRYHCGDDDRGDDQLT